MELIRNLETRVSKNGRKQSWGEFYCTFCKMLVKRHLGAGKQAKSCGCERYKLSSKAQKGKKRKPLTGEHKQRMRESFQGENNPFYGKNHSEEVKDKISKAKKGIKLTEEHKQKLKENHANYVGENNPMYGKYGDLSGNWINGSSFEPYGIEFNKKLKQTILERDNYKCQNPKCKIEHPKRLDVHHIDYNKMNNILENLITLCMNCHLKTNGKNNRHYWTEFYQKVMEDTENAGRT